MRKPHQRPLDRGTIVIALVVVIGAMMSILDTTIVNVALAMLGRELHTSLPTIQWQSARPQRSAA